MSDPSPARPHGAIAGSLILGAMLTFALIGAALGAVVGAVGLLAVAGVLVGFFVGTWLVYRRFRDL